MNLQWKGLHYLLLCCFVLSSSVFAAASVSPSVYKKAHHNKHRYKDKGIWKDGAYVSQNHFEIIGAGGIAKLNAGNGQLGVTSSETDTLVQNNSNTWNTLAAQLGIGYVYYFGDSQQYSDHVQWFPSIEPELNLYYLSSNSINGYVQRFGNPDYNELNFDVPFHSTRLMFDAALTVTSWKQLSLYGLAGVGYARNRVSYSDTSNGTADCTDQLVSLGSNNNNNFVWEAGAGLDFAFNDRFSMFVEYLYTDLGTVKTSGSGNAGTITSPVFSAPQFHVKSQTALLGINIGL